MRHSLCRPPAATFYTSMDRILLLDQSSDAQPQLPFSGKFPDFPLTQSKARKKGNNGSCNKAAASKLVLAASAEGPVTLTSPVNLFWSLMVEGNVRAARMCVCSMGNLC